MATLQKNLKYVFSPHHLRTNAMRTKRYKNAHNVTIQNMSLEGDTSLISPDSAMNFSSSFKSLAGFCISITRLDAIFFI